VTTALCWRFGGIARTAIVGIAFRQKEKPI
jgi:hypothetical protein